MATKAAEPVQVRFRISRSGLTYGLHGIERGQVVEVPTTAEAARLYAAGYAQPPHLKELGAPYVPYTSASRLRDTLSPARRLSSHPRAREVRDGAANCSPRLQEP